MGNNIVIPVTDASARPQVVTDHFKLADALQLALNQLGDGLFPLSGIVATGPLAGRALSALNGEVIAGTGLQVKVRDMVALIDGMVLTDKNASQFDAESTTSLAVPANSTKYIVLRPQRITGTDGADRPDMAPGVLSVEATMPLDRSGLALAKVVTGASSVSSIDLSVRKMLSNLGELQSLESAMAALGNQGGTDLDNTIRMAQTNFKIDTALSIATNALLKGWVDVFSDASDIDTGLSSAYALDPVLKEIDAVAGSGGILANCTDYYQMDEPSGSILLDSARGGSRCLFLDAANGPASNRVPGKIGNAIDTTNGDHAVGQVGMIDWTASDWSVALWGKLVTGGDSGSADGLITFRANADGTIGDPSQGWISLGILGVAKGLRLECASGSGFYQVAQDFAFVNDTNWHQFVLTFSASTFAVKCYLDGTLVQTITMDQAMQGGGNRFPTLGFWADNSGNFWRGLIDEVSVFSPLLTQSDVTALMASVTPTSGGFSAGVVVSKAHAATVAPTQALLVAEGTSDLTFSVSRDNGTTWTAATNGELVTISGQPSGTQMRYKVGLPAKTSVLANIALFWK